MPHRNWAERVDDELARRGVPARFRRRLLAELRDHADDLTDGEGLTMTDDELNARLGEPAALATQAAEEYRRARWTSRHPLLVFGLLPLPATLLVFAATVLLLGLAASVLGVAPGDVDNLPTPRWSPSYAVAWACGSCRSLSWLSFTHDCTCGAGSAGGGSPAPVRILLVPSMIRHHRSDSPPVAVDDRVAQRCRWAMGDASFPTPLAGCRSCNLSCGRSACVPRRPPEAGRTRPWRLNPERVPGHQFRTVAVTP